MVEKLPELLSHGPPSNVGSQAKEGFSPQLLDERCCPRSRSCSPRLGHEEPALDSKFTALSPSQCCLSNPPQLLKTSSPCACGAGGAVHVSVPGAASAPLPDTGARDMEKTNPSPAHNRHLIMVRLMSCCRCKENDLGSTCVTGVLLLGTFCWGASWP